MKTMSKYEGMIRVPLNMMIKLSSTYVATNYATASLVPLNLGGGGWGPGNASRLNSVAVWKALVALLIAEIKPP